MASSSALGSFNLSSIQTLNGSNFKRWNQDLEIALGLMDLDLALREDEPPAITAESTIEQKQKKEKWDKANRMSILIMKRTMTDTVRGGVASNDNAKAFLEGIGAKFKESQKAETSNLMTMLTTSRYDGTSGVREHIMKLSDVASKLNDLKVTVSDPFLVHMALNSLPAKFEQLKVSYNTQKEAWDLNELISICAQEEDRHKQNIMEVNLVHSTNKNDASGSGKILNTAKFTNVPANTTHQPPKGPHGLKVTKTDITKKVSFKCYFCKKAGHMKKNCDKHKNWQKKKGIHKQESTN
ncbi:hypothetical protein LguiA_000854 [Lonicera macranthoides]